MGLHAPMNALLAMQAKRSKPTRAWSVQSKPKSHTLTPISVLHGFRMGVNGFSMGCMPRSDTLQITPEILSLMIVSRRVV